MDDIAQRGQRQQPEVRSFTVSDLEIRANKNDGRVTFDGIASVVDTPYGVRDQYGEYEETIQAKAFHRTIEQRDDIRLLKNHNADAVFARTKSGTLELSETPHLRALAPSLDPANPAVQTLRSELERGDVDQMSIGFRVLDQEWSDDWTQRTIKEVSLQEVSIVAFPASPTTSATIRSADAVLVPLLADDADEDEIRRAIAMLEARLGSAGETGFSKRDALRALLEAKK